MIWGIGVDLVDVRRIERLLNKHQARFLRRFFTPYEQDEGSQRAQPALFYATRFAAKEAFVKALGTGMRDGMFFSHIGVISTIYGRPTVNLTPFAQAYVKKLLPSGENIRIDLSLTDEYPYAQAFVIISNYRIGQGGYRKKICSRTQGMGLVSHSGHQFRNIRTCFSF